MTKTLDTTVLEGTGKFDMNSFINSPQIDRKEYRKTMSNLRKYNASNFGYNLDEGNILYRGAKNIADFFFKKHKTKKAKEFFEHEKELKNELKSYHKITDQYIEFYKNAFTECKDGFDDLIMDNSKLNSSYKVKSKAIESEDLAADKLFGVEKYFEKAKVKLKKFFLDGQHKVYTASLGLKELSLNSRRNLIEKKYRDTLKNSLKLKSALEQLEISEDLYKTYLLKNKGLFK